MKGKEVWVVRFHSWNFSDCDGVFATKHGASDSLLEHLKRCTHWKNWRIEAESDDGSWITFAFEYQTYLGKKVETEFVTMYSTKIE